MKGVPDIVSIIPPTSKEVPIILNLPHSGTYIPPSIANKLKEEKLAELDETDWFLDKLYSFAPSLGITTTIANYHRWVVDLNRSIDGASLYTDGRVITGVVPSVDFNGDPLYKSRKPSKLEIEARLQKYYIPYYAKVNKLLESMVSKYGRVLLWDGHSIRRHVPGIQENPFPDLIIGTADSTTAPLQLIEAVLEKLESSGIETSYNTPFKGGNITRSLADVKRNIFTIQLEMCKDLYMDISERDFHVEKSKVVSKLLLNTFQKIIQEL